MTCAAASLAADEPLAGTAPRAVAWLALEQDGPWGRDALTQSHLDPELGARLAAAAATAGVRPALVRVPGRHASGRFDGPRRVLAACTVPGSTWLLEGTAERPEQVLEVDLEALARGDRAAVEASAPWLSVTDEPHLLVCTNGTRDTCCAVLGRPVARDAWYATPGRVWETTHTSGHRFAATSVLLPWGYLHGRLDTETATRVLADADVGLVAPDLPVGGVRGRSTWGPAGQVAELAVRRTAGEEDADALVVTEDPALPPDGSPALAEVAHADGRRWQVPVRLVTSGATREESCGRSGKPVVAAVHDEVVVVGPA